MALDRTYINSLTDDNGTGNGTPVDKAMFGSIYDDVDAALATTTPSATVPGGRLTLTSGNALTSADVTGAGTLYYTAFSSNWVWTYDSSVWTPHTFAEISLALTVTSGKLYDVFLYYGSGALHLELSAAWTNDSTPVDALATQDGVDVKSADHSRLWVGTICASASNATEDSLTKRYVSNRYNIMARAMRRLETSSSWTYSTDAWRQANNSTSNQLDFVNCRAGLSLFATVMGQAEGSSINPIPLVAAGLDSTTAEATGCLKSGNKLAVTGVGQPTSASLCTYPARGRHSLTWLERVVSTAGTITWYGSNSNLQTGLDAETYG